MSEIESGEEGIKSIIRKINRLERFIRVTEQALKDATELEKSYDELTSLCDQLNKQQKKEAAKKEKEKEKKSKETTLP